MSRVKDACSLEPRFAREHFENVVCVSCSGGLCGYGDFKRDDAGTRCLKNSGFKGAGGDGATLRREVHVCA